ncbi:hypothetical protein V8C34DRAFT_304206 [Trichoderma compactum]
MRAAPSGQGGRGGMAFRSSVCRAHNFFVPTPQQPRQFESTGSRARTGEIDNNVTDDCQGPRVTKNDI